MRVPTSSLFTYRHMCIYKPLSSINSHVRNYWLTSQNFHFTFITSFRRLLYFILGNSHFNYRSPTGWGACATWWVKLKCRGFECQWWPRASFINRDDLYRHRTLQWRHNGRDGVSNHQPHPCLLNRLFRRRSKKTSKLRVTGLCAGNSPETGEFPAEKASNAENISIWWRHHGLGHEQVSTST